MPPQVVAEALEATAPSFAASSVRVRISIENDADIAVAGEHGRRLASRLDFSPADVTVIAAQQNTDTTTLIVAGAWWSIAVISGLLLGRSARAAEAVREVLAGARTTTTLPSDT